MKKGEKMSTNQKKKISKTLNERNPEINYDKHASYFLQNQGWKYLDKKYRLYPNGVTLYNQVLGARDFKNTKEVVKFCDKFYGRIWLEYKNKCRRLENAGLY